MSAKLISRITAHATRRPVGNLTGTPLYVLIAAAVLTGWLLPLYWNDSYVLDVLCLTGLFVLMSAGLSIVVSLAGLLDLGYIAFWAVGAYSAALLSSSQFHVSLPFLLIFPVAVLATSVFAVLIGFPTLRLRGDYLAVVTMGFGEIVRIFLINAEVITGGPAGISNIARPNLFGYAFTYRLEPYYYLIYGFCVVGLLLVQWLNTRPIGLIWKALRDDELAATTSGVRPLSYYLAAFAIGAGYAGISGALFALKQSAISPDSFTVDGSILVLAVVVLSGLSGRPLPIILAAVIAIAVPEALRGFKEYRLVVFGPLLVLVVVVRNNSDVIASRIREIGRAIRSQATTRPPQV